MGRGKASRPIAEIGAAVAGTGFIGVVHVEALRRLGVQVHGVVGSSHARAAGRAAALGLPPGHNEGYADTFKALYRAVYRAVAGDGPSEPDYPTFADGHESMLDCEAVARSARDGTWARVRG